MLLLRGTQWSVDAFSAGGLFVFASIVVLVVLPTYAFGFRTIVGKNIRRLAILPERAPIWSVSSFRGYMMVGGMVALGVILRSTSIPRVYLAGPYLVMGGCLLAGSVEIAMTSFRERRHRRTDHANGAEAG